MLEKDKNCIEFSMSSMMVTHKPYQEDTEIAIEGMAPEKNLLLANNPFDIPCDVVVVSRSYFEALQTENEQLKKKLEEFSPIPEYKEFLMHLYSVEDAEKLEWVLRHVSGGMASTNEWIAISKFWKNNYATLSELVGFSSVEEIEDYLVNEAECDTLQEAILKLIKENKYACEKWASANSSNNSWKAAAECNSPKELIEKIEGLEGKVKVLETEAEVYSRALLDWKEGTGCPSPAAAKTLIESGASWHHAYHEVNKANKKLGEEVDSWKNTTGYSAPEDYMHARISGAFHTPFDYTAAWQKATGCNTPEQAKERIKALNERIDESEADYNHLLCTTGFGSEGEIEDALDQCDHSTLRKALVGYEFDYENLLKLTGYKSEHDIRVLLNNSEQFVYESVRELINSLKRKAKFTESNWQTATGCDTPDKARNSIANMVDSKETTIYLGDVHNVIAKWQKATGFDSPKAFLKWKANIEGILEAWKERTGCKYPGEAGELLEKWKVLTKCETPEAAATWITAYESACGRGNRLADSVENLKEEVVSWKSVTGHSTPEDFLSAKINKGVKEVSSWEEITGFSTPEKCSLYIDKLEKKLEDIKDLAEEA